MKNKRVFSGVLLAVTGALCMLSIVGCDNATTPTTTTQYTVTFHANGGEVSPNTETVEEGKTLPSLPTPTKTSGEDIFFQGWRTKNGANNDWGKSFTGAESIVADITVYAKWGSVALTQYTVTFNPDGGAVAPPSVKIYSGDPVGTLPVPTKGGNTFGGWWTARNGGGTQFTEAFMVNANTTIYAKWTAITDGNPKKIAITGLSVYSGERVQVILTSKGTLPIEHADIVVASNNDQGGELIPSGGNVEAPLYVASNQPWTGSESYYVLFTIFRGNDVSRFEFLSNQKIQFASATTLVQFSTSAFTGNGTPTKFDGVWRGTFNNNPTRFIFSGDWMVQQLLYNNKWQNEGVWTKFTFTNTEITMEDSGAGNPLTLVYILLDTTLTFTEYNVSLEKEG
jgi:hypothetical protein